MQQRILFSPELLRFRKYRERKSLNPLESLKRKRYSVAGYVRYQYFSERNHNISG